jgi:hypothetical protein
MSANEEIFFEESTPKQPEDEPQNQQQDEDEPQNQQQDEETQAQQQGEETQAQQQFREFKKAPGEFLSKNPVRIVGEKTSGVLPYYFYKDDYEVYQITPDPEGRAQTIYPGGVTFQAHNLAVETLNNTNWGEEETDAIEIPWYNLNEHEVSLMMTTQLSGCAFCFKEIGEQYLVAHIKPANTTGATVQEQLIKRGRFEEFPDEKLNVFGASMNYDPDKERAYVISVKQNGKWTHHVQVTDGNLSSPEIKATFSFAEGM